MDDCLPSGAVRRGGEGRGVNHFPLAGTKLGDGAKAVAGSRLVLDTARAALQLRRLAPDFDVVVVNSVMSLPAARLGLRQAKVVWLVHDVITRPGLRRVARLSRSVVDLAVGVSNASAAFPQHLGMPTSVVYNGVSTPVPPACPQAEPPIVGVNAMLTSWKGQKEFLEAMRLVEFPFEIELMGGAFAKDATYERQLRVLAEDPSLAGRVRLLGHVDDPLEVMRRWSIAVSASIEPEAGPLAVLEAMSIGLPVVVTDHGGAVEIAGEVALRAEPRNLQAMAVAVEKLLRSPADREMRGRQGREIVQQRFGLQKAYEQFAGVLRDVVDA